jgi:hypothetical protein
MAFMSATPGAPDDLTHIPPMALQMGIQRALGIVRTYGLDADGNALRCPAATHQHVASSLHSAICQATGVHYVRHQALAHTWKMMAKEAGITRVHTESGRAFTGQRNRERFERTGRSLRMDVELEPGTFSGIERRGIEEEVGLAKGILLDVTCRNAQTESALRLGSARRPGVAAAKAETDKHNTYAGYYCPATHHLLCLAVEVHGRIGTEAETFLKMLVGRATRDMVLEADVNRVRSSITARLRQQLSCGLVKALAAGEVRYVRRLRDRPVMVDRAQWDSSVMGLEYGGYRREGGSAGG